MPPFEKNPDHWLFKMTPDEWIRAALRELRAAEAAYGQRNARAGLASCRRAAGMALNGALIVEPNEAWRRTYVEHIDALGRDEAVPQAVRDACAVLLAALPGPDLVLLRSRASDERVLEAARDVVAHAYAVVKRHEPRESS